MSEMESHTGRRGRKAREKGHEEPRGATKGSENKGSGGGQVRGEAVANPSEGAKGGGMRDLLDRDVTS